MIVLRTTFGSPTESCEPTILNSNLLPVKANGDVRFLSVASFLKSGRALTPVSSFSPFLDLVAVPVEISCVKTSWSCSPRYTEIITGGASLPPRRWSLPTSDADSLRRSAWRSTALSTRQRISKNWMFSCGDLPGSKRLIPSSVTSDQLSCLPEPLTPLNGFSWSRHWRPCRLATLRSVSMIIWLWSTATLHWA